MKKILVSPLFLLGVFIRIALVFIIYPTSVVEWYVPFLDASTVTFNVNPWSTWLNQGGSSEAFPYGYVMWLVFLPLTLLFKAVGLPIILGYGTTLIATDCALLFLLRKIIPNRERLLLTTYWLSPIVIVASYFLGFNDLIPVFFLTLSLYFIKEKKLTLSGLTLVLAISAKLSMILALPFFLIYLFHNRALRQVSLKFFKGIAIGTITVIVPFLLSNAGLNMLVNNPEMAKVYYLAFNIGDAIQIYVVPLVYLLMLYSVWRVRRLNFDLFNATLGIAFLLVVLMTPASPGWFIWAIPLLVNYQASSDKMATVLATVFSILYVLSSILLNPDEFFIDGKLGLFGPAFQMNGTLASLIHTAMVVVGIALIVRIWRETISQNDFFRLSRNPFVIGVAGDSGAGKDTFSDSMKDLFGRHSVTALSGDDYHLWDRHKPMWKVMTHLNPMANDLESFAKDLVDLRDGKSIYSSHYNHNTGRMTRPFKIKSNDIIIASGLHALYMPILRECYNLSVYLDIDENLRRHFKLERDVHQRGHDIEKVLTSMERREPDSKRFIRPQATNADLILSLQPINPRTLNDYDKIKQPLCFKLIARSRHGLNEVSLTRVLVGVCGLHVDMVPNADASEVQLTIEGEVTAEDISLAAKMVCPQIFEFLDIQPKWQDGVTGLMQLITLSHINQTLKKRFIC
jgi:uridine kinase